MAYTIVFKDYDGTVLQTSEVESGVVPEYTGETPTRAADEHHSYTFSGWTPEIVAAEADAEYTAAYTETNLYTITWIDGDGNTLNTSVVEEGETPAYTGDTPTKTATQQYTYTFSNDWTPDIVPAVEDASYTALFTATINQYSVKFVDYDESVLKPETLYDYGTPAASIVRPTDPFREPDEHNDYWFIGWTPEVSEVTDNVVYVATYEVYPHEYEITFLNDNGNLLEKKLVPYGTVPTYTGPSLENEGMKIFSGWTPTLAAVTGDAEYTAVYTTTVIEVACDESMSPKHHRGIYQLSSAADIEAMPACVAPGSIAYLPDLSKVWILALGGTWTESTTDALMLAAMY